ncbi:MAG: hypothetical protein K2W95_09115 [Candidatus Obscuribacterales bacterium]|nr:hypothetical protein [Candidatus Obscuribacterales bacterium]
MKYIKVRWIHEFDDEPILYFEELDDSRYERRRIEIYRSGVICPMTARELEALGPVDHMPLPEVSDLNRDEDFEAEEITAAEFETQWQLATAT